MEDNFTASNGIIVGRMQNPLRWVLNPLERTYHITPLELDALREFFRAEEDERLGRWRWPENPSYLVYGSEGGHNVLDEVKGETYFVPAEHRSPEDYGGGVREAVKAVDAYFDAHPEPKPWHGAKPGEVWVIVTRNVGEERAVQVYGNSFVYNDGISYPLTYDAIDSARRIWPEVSS